MESIKKNLKILTPCVIILTFIAAGAALYWLRSVLIPFVLALFFFYCLNPLVDFQIRRLRVPRPLAILLTIILGLVLLFLVGTLVSSSINQMRIHSDDYRSRLIQLQQKSLEILPENLFGMPVKETGAKMLKVPEDVAGKTLSGLIGTLLNLFSNGVLVAIFMFFLLLGSSPLQKKSRGVLGEVQTSIRNYIRLKVIISIVTGGVHGIILMLFGVEFAVVFGILAFLLNFIPNLGPVLTTLLPIPVIILSPDLSPTAIILAIMLTGGVQFASGNVFEPRIMGESLDLHPVVVLLSLIFFGMIWGMAGMFLATPITGALKIMFEKIENTRTIAHLMAGRLEDLEKEPA